MCNQHMLGYMGLCSLEMDTLCAYLNTVLVIAAVVPIGAIIGAIIAVIIGAIIGVIVCIRRSLRGVRWAPILSHGLLIRHAEGKFWQFRQSVTTSS